MSEPLSVEDLLEGYPATDGMELGFSDSVDPAALQGAENRFGPLPADYKALLVSRGPFTIGRPDDPSVGHRSFRLWGVDSLCRASQLKGREAVEIINEDRRTGLWKVWAFISRTLAPLFSSLLYLRMRKLVVFAQQGDTFFAFDGRTKAERVVTLHDDHGEGSFYELQHDDAQFASFRAFVANVLAEASQK